MKRCCAPSGTIAPGRLIEVGARHVAEFAVAQIRGQRLPLAKWLK